MHFSCLDKLFIMHAFCLWFKDHFHDEPRLRVNHSTESWLTGQYCFCFRCVTVSAPRANQRTSLFVCEAGGRNKFDSLLCIKTVLHCTRSVSTRSIFDTFHKHGITISTRKSHNFEIRIELRNLFQPFIACTTRIDWIATFIITSMLRTSNVHQQQLGF